MTDRLLEVSNEYGTTIHKLPKHRLEAIAGSALTGFTIMEAAESPWQCVRDQLGKRIINQDGALDAIIDALDARTARLASDKRPITTLAFLGPTGVGKSETAKALAAVLGNGGDGNLVKIDCSEYSNGHEVANLTGSPLGYIGSHNTPIINKADIENLGTVVLFDEIERGSKELYDLMLQIMEDGELRITGGEKVSFRDAIIILSSNLGEKEMSARLSPTSLGFTKRTGESSTPELDTVAVEAFDKFFQPAFINRIDKKIVFHSLDADALGRVLQVRLQDLNREYRSRYGARLSLSDTAAGQLVNEASQNPQLGARPLVRALNSNILANFGRYLGSGMVTEGTHVRVFHSSEVEGCTDSEFIFARQADPSIKIRKKRPKQLELIEEMAAAETHEEAEAGDDV